MRNRLGWGTRRGATRLHCFGFVLVGVLLASPLKLGVVDGSSMEPTLQHGQVYFMDRTHYLHNPVRRGDVVVFRKDNENYVKRVAAGPGDTIYLLRMREPRTEDVKEDMLVAAFQLPKLQAAMQRPPWSTSYKLIKRTVPEGFYFMLGDHRGVSTDSRQFGLISREEIFAHVLFMGNGPAPGEAIAGHFTLRPRS